jgi:MoxR-vWA-beta-propeller ternary system domain bpX0/MoxR-vWA-beta-propeller ternary system domain bpX1
VVKSSSMSLGNASSILQKYITPPSDACWRWDETGESVVWSDGTTIAFWSEIVGILRSLSEQGWPSFNAVVLVLAACRSTWSTVADVNLAHAKELVQEAAVREQIVLLWFSRCLSGLQAVAELPTQLRESVDARLTLCRSVFAKVPNIYLSPMMLPLVPDALGRPPIAENEPWWPTLRADLYSLSVGLADLSEQRLALRTQTGVEELPVPTEDLPDVTATQVRQVLDADDDDEIGFVVRLARSVLGALPMYQRLSEPEGLPLGGIVDLQNRGQLDHLVLSELANDDDVLTARLALSEALYLRRETPERTPDGARLILLDVGVRQWGTARLVALAAALALAAQGDPRQPVRAWVAQGHGLREINLGTRDGVVAALTCLRPEPTPAAALAAFVRQARARDEMMLITGPRALADAQLEQALITVNFVGLVATTTSAGAFRLLHCGARGQRELAAAQLDLERCRVRPNRHRSTKSSTTIAPTTIPDPINRIAPFPLRLPHQVDLEQAIALSGGDGVLSISPRGHMTWWDDPTAGPRRLLSDLPIGRVHALGRTDEMLLWVLIHRRADKRLILCTSDDGSSHVTFDLGAVEEIQTAWAVGQVVLVVLRERVVAYGMDGRFIDDLALPVGARWWHGQYIQDSQIWYRITHSGTALRLERRVGPPGIASGILLNCRVIDIEGRDGSWLVHNLNVWSTEKNTLSTKIPVPDNLQRALAQGGTEQRRWGVGKISRNGLRIIFQGPNGAFFGYDLSKKQHFKGNPRLLEPGIMAWTESHQGMITHTSAISVEADQIRVHHQRDKCHVFVVHGDELRLRTSERLPAGSRRIELVPGGERLRRWLRADHNDVMVFLDGSGLLHLTDTSGALPAIALVLAAGVSACWCSEGWVHGPRRFVGTQASASIEHVATVLTAYARRLA